MNKGKINNHTRNQKRMYRIHKQEELIEKQRYIIGDLQERIDKAIEYINNLRDESAERQGFYNCFPDDLFIPNIEELLQLLKGESNE